MTSVAAVKTDHPVDPECMPKVLCSQQKHAPVQLVVILKFIHNVDKHFLTEKILIDRELLLKPLLFKETEKVMPMTANIILSFLKSSYKMCNNEFANLRKVVTSCEQNTYLYQINQVFMDYF